MPASVWCRPIPERMQPRVLHELAAASRPRELWDELAGLRCPLLVARAGGAGGILTDACIERYRSVRPDVEVVVVPDAPHDLFRVDRTCYPRAVTEFIARRCPDD